MLLLIITKTESMNDQTNKNISNSNITNVMGNVNTYNGLSFQEARELFNLLIEKEMALFRQEARVEADKRFNEIKDMILSEVAKYDERLLVRFKDPAIQIALHETMFNYIKTGDEKLGHIMVGYLIDRLHVEERSTTLALIDEARSIIPKLSAKVVALLAFKVFGGIKFDVLFTSEKYDKYLDDLSVLAEDIKGLSSMDIDFLKQLGCADNKMMFTDSSFKEESIYLETNLLKRYDLFYRHPITNEMFREVVINNNDLIEKDSENNIDLLRAPFIKVKDSDKLFRFNFLMSETILSAYSCNKELIPAFEQLKQKAVAYTLQEVREYHIAKNPYWADVFKIFSNRIIHTLVLNPVAVYIGAKQLEKVCGIEIPLSIFYKRL